MKRHSNSQLDFSILTEQTQITRTTKMELRTNKTEDFFPKIKQIHGDTGYELNVWLAFYAPQVVFFLNFIFTVIFEHPSENFGPPSALGPLGMCLVCPVISVILVIAYFGMASSLPHISFLHFKIF